MASSATMAGALKSATTVMAAHNAELKKMDMPATMREFAMQSERMGMTEEAMDDMLEDALGDGDSDEEDELVAGVLGEIGLDMGARLDAAPTGPVGVGAGAGVSSTSAEEEAMLRSVLG